MNCYSNIEFINYECQDNDNATLSGESNCINMEYLNNFMLDKFNPDAHQALSNDLINSITNSIENYELCSNNSYYSGCNTDSMSCFSDNFCLNYQSDTNSVSDFKLLNHSFDNCNSLSPISDKLDTSPSSSLFSARVFRCQEQGCDKVYKSKENLTLHVKNIHLKEKPYGCKYCSALFSHRNGKTYHERKFHTKYLPHKCNIDGKYFFFNLF